MGYYFNNKGFKRLQVLSAFGVGLAILIFYPVKGDDVLLVTRFNRIVFTIACILVTFGFFKMDFNLGKVDWPLKMLGEISYSVYLLHPLV